MLTDQRSIGHNICFPMASRKDFKIRTWKLELDILYIQCKQCLKRRKRTF